MKRLLLIVFLITQIGFAQRGEKLRAYKTAFITDAVELTPAEAEKFWPIYNKFDEKLMGLRMRERTEIFEMVKGNVDDLSESEANSLLLKIRAIKKEEQQYHEQMLDELLKVLPAKKVLKLKKAEEEFKHTLLDRFKNRRNDDRR